MRLFHVSEESNIKIFEPRKPLRDDLDKNIGLVWAIDEKRLPNFLTPRNCPRVCYHASKTTAKEDKEHFFASKSTDYAVAIEHKWYEVMKNTTLYVYEFNTKDFVLQDAVAGYYIAKTSQVPIAKYVYTDLFSALIKRNVEIRIVDNLFDIAEKVKKSSLNWSLCRMAFAEKKKE